MSPPKRRLPIGTILFFLFASFTLLEIWLIFLLAEWTSWPFTVALAIVSAVLGSAMAKHQGLAVVTRARRDLESGRFPARSLADGVMILLGGALLITPGLITDLLGFSTLVPAVRRVYATLLMRWAKRVFVLRSTGPTPRGFQAHFGGAQSNNPRPGVFDAEPGTFGHSNNSDAVDVEFRRVDDE